MPGVSGRVRVQVVGEGPPVLFLHGVNTSGAVWAPLVAALPGSGVWSSTARGAGSATLARVARSLVVDVLDALGLGRAAVVSTSLGGYYDLRAAEAHPDRVSGVLELGWPVGAPDGHLPVVMRIGGARTLGRLTARLPVPRAAIRPMLGRIGLRSAVRAGRVSEAMVDWFHALLQETSTMRNELDAAPPFFHALRGADPSIAIPDEALSAIRPPVHFVWGDEDPFGDVDVASAFASKIGSGASLEVFSGAGPAPWIDDPERCAAVARRFLANGPHRDG